MVAGPFIDHIWKIPESAGVFSHAVSRFHFGQQNQLQGPETLYLDTHKHIYTPLHTGT